ncbi:hypothetical protein FA95DRAFT_1348607 [Auriscalpium vulgare]|uniref:Uncharacterized protein n=1 Tax=Auriscalpium vulgare TaxID=40419 RepID=A0ACB8RS01_9AGAM|nr:hypothetical protein FA95DRAFT_1348607 [Auriscalpium vulgare]
MLHPSDLFAHQTLSRILLGRQYPVASQAQVLPATLRCPRRPFVQDNGRAWDLERRESTLTNRPKFLCERHDVEEEFSRDDAPAPTRGTCCCRASSYHVDPTVRLPHGLHNHGP